MINVSVPLQNRLNQHLAYQASVFLFRSNLLHDLLAFCSNPYEVGDLERPGCLSALKVRFCHRDDPTHFVTAKARGIFRVLLCRLNPVIKCPCHRAFIRIRKWTRSDDKANLEHEPFRSICYLVGTKRGQAGSVSKKYINHMIRIEPSVRNGSSWYLVLHPAMSRPWRHEFLHINSYVKREGMTWLTKASIVAKM